MPSFVHKQHHFSLWLNEAPRWVAKGIAKADSAVEVLWEKVCLLYWLSSLFFCTCSCINNVITDWARLSSASSALAASVLLLRVFTHYQCNDCACMSLDIYVYVYIV